MRVNLNEKVKWFVVNVSMVPRTDADICDCVKVGYCDEYDPMSKYIKCKNILPYKNDNMYVYTFNDITLGVYYTQKENAATISFLFAGNCGNNVAEGYISNSDGVDKYVLVTSIPLLSYGDCKLVDKAPCTIIYDNTDGLIKHFDSKELHKSFVI